MSPRPVRSQGRPGTSVIPSTWSAGHRPVVNATHTGTCTIRHPGGTPGVFDPVTGETPVTPYTPHYVGACRVQVMPALEQEIVTGGQEVTMVGYRVTIRYDAADDLAVGDLLTITGVDDNGDPALVGVTMRVDSFERGSLAWERVIHATDNLG